MVDQTILLTLVIKIREARRWPKHEISLIQMMSDSKTDQWWREEDLRLKLQEDNNGDFSEKTKTVEKQIQILPKQTDQWWR